MKVTIDADGMLTIQAESGLETYALGQWSQTHVAYLSSGQSGLIIRPEPPQGEES